MDNDVEIQLTVGTMREVREGVIRALEAGLVPMVTSTPGVGKSAMYDSICKQANWEKIDHRVSTSIPEDFSGYPDLSGTKAVFKPFALFPIEGMDEVPKGKNGWMMLFDEFNSGKPAVIAAAYKTVLDRFVGQNKLHPSVVIACAGNGITDRAIVNELGTAMRSRLIHFEVEMKSKKAFEEFMEDVAYKYMWHHQVVGFLHYKNAYLDTFDPTSTEKTFACPRTWDFMQRMAKKKDITIADKLLCVGTLGQTIGTEFVTYCEYYSNLPKLQDIIDEPMLTEVPIKSALRYALMTSLWDKVNIQNFRYIAEYVNRFPLELKIVFYRGVRAISPEVTETDAWRTNFVQVARHLT